MNPVNDIVASVLETRFSLSLDQPQLYVPRKSVVRNFLDHFKPRGMKATKGCAMYVQLELMLMVSFVIK
jgi:hypothetical protein